MPSYRERSQQAKIESENVYYSAQKQINNSVQIGTKRGDTGRHEVIHADGGVTGNGDKVFNANVPQDGFVRGYASDNAIALEHRNYKRTNKLLQGIEETATKTLILVSYDLLGFFVFSGNGVSGNPFSAVDVYSDRAGLPIDSQDGVIYTIDSNTGELTNKDGELPLLAPSGNDPLNSINRAESIYFQDFEGESNQTGATISGSYIDHVGLTPPSQSLGFSELSLKFNLLAQPFLKEWDGLSQIEDLDNKIIDLDGLLDLEKRAIILTKAIIDTGLESVRDTTIDVIAAIRISTGNLFFGAGLEFTLVKIFESKLAVLPPTIPPILPDEEFANLPTAINDLITKLNIFIADPTITTVSNAETQARKCTSEGERVLTLNTFITANGFTDYLARINSVPADNIFLYYYERTWDLLSSSSLEFEVDIVGVTLTGNYSASFIRQSAFYYMYTSTDVLGIPFGLAQYIANFKWRKRGNTEWFSI